MYHDTVNENFPFQNQQASYVSKYSANSGSTTSSPSSNSNSSFLSTQHINRHVKNNSVDIRFPDEGLGESGSVGDGSLSNQNAMNKVFPPISTQTNASSTASLEYARF